MHARFPQDVDLEDRVLLGLTPIRFGYLAVAGLCSFCIWSIDWATAWDRGPAGLPPLLAGLVLAWGRLRGRQVDCWIADVAIFVMRRIATRSAPLRRRRRPGAHRCTR